MKKVILIMALLAFGIGILTSSISSTKSSGINIVDESAAPPKTIARGLDRV